MLTESSERRHRPPGRRIVAHEYLLDSTVGKPRLNHAIRLIHGTSREAASHALGREKRIAGKARRCEFVLIIKAHTATVSLNFVQDCDGPFK